MLIIGSSDTKGLAYIETKNLDGETNLKHKTVPKDVFRTFETEKEVKSILE